MTPIVPEAAATAPASSGGYPFFFMWGMVRPPIAATVAGFEPEIEPKNSDAPVVILARAAGLRLSINCTKLIIRFDIPPLAMRFPARIKNGIAIKGKLSTAVNIRCGTMGKRWVKSPAIKTTIRDSPSETAMGSPKASISASIPNKRPGIFLSLLLLAVTGTQFLYTMRNVADQH
jgi:hypothetical protein